MPFASIVPCLTFFLSGIQHWHTLVSNTQGAGGTASARGAEATVERNMELCASSLRRVLASDLFVFERLTDLAARAPADWQAFTAALAATCQATAGVPKLKPLWDSLKTLSDPLQVSLSGVGARGGGGREVSLRGCRGLGGGLS
jgi:hypothetical protein